MITCSFPVAIYGWCCGWVADHTGSEWWEDRQAGAMDALAWLQGEK